MPFILANAWLASALMEFPRIMPVLYGEYRRIGQCGESVSDLRARRAARMTYLSWDEIEPCVLTLRCLHFAGPDPGRDGKRQQPHGPGDHPNEFYAFFPHRHDRADPAGGDCLGWRRAGAIAGAGGQPNGYAGPSRSEQSGDPGAGPISDTEPGADRDPCPGGKPFRPARGSPGSRADPGDAAGGRAGSDRRSVRRTDHAGAQKRSSSSRATPTGIRRSTP